MFKNTRAFSSFSVNDLEKAKHFYGELLQLEAVEKHYVLELHVPGAGGILIYPKDNHEPATFTILNFPVPDIMKTVKELENAGIQLESYDLPGMKTDEHHIFHDDNMHIKIAWFKDPAGNILSVIEEHTVS